jgi:flavin-dependent dehydrogenase
MPDIPQAADVVILGGGLAGQTLARQLAQERSELDILVAEKRPFPFPEAAHKVGESSVEYGSHYLREKLGLKAYLDEHQLPKLALRFFCTADNDMIESRFEHGLREFPPVPSHQLDRGTLENALTEMNRDMGVNIVDETIVKAVELNSSSHQVTLQRGAERRTVSARWVVDASGRAGLLKRQQGLARRTRHDTNAAWFRIADQVKIDEWAEQPAWRRQVPEDRRWLSTNHLVGPGYWAWLIPLSSGSTSVGLVADPRYVDFGRMNRFERLLDWFGENEPQLGREVEARRDALQDFLTLKHYSHGCRRLFSAERWCITGIAGAFLDPLYSPGTDFIGLSNCFITDLILRELDGFADVEGLAARYNLLYLSQFRTFLPLFEGQYGLFGHQRVLAAKLLWDTAIYLTVLVPLFRSDAQLHPQTFDAVAVDLSFLAVMNRRMQRWFSVWASLREGAPAAGAPVQSDRLVDRVYADLRGPATLVGLPEATRRNAIWLAALAKEIIERVTNHAVDGPSGWSEPPLRTATGYLQNVGVAWHDLEEFGLRWTDDRGEIIHGDDAPSEKVVHWKLDLPAEVSA